jgi:Domain of unknown function (DUF4375)
MLPMTDDDFDALWKNLVKRSHHQRVPLTDNEKVFYAVNLLRGSVLRSGFIGYFENWTSSDILAAHRGLRILGLETTLGLLSEAQSIVLGGRSLPNEPVSLTVFPDSLTEAEYEQASARMDESLAFIEEQFYPLNKEIYTALCAFADAHHLAPIDLA